MELRTVSDDTTTEATPIETVGDLRRKLGEFDQSKPIRICADFPFHRYITEVSEPEAWLTDPCVAIYA